MDILKEKITNELIKNLLSLKSIYGTEIDLIIDNLLNENFESLNKFLNKNYSDLDYSDHIKNLVLELVNKSFLDKDYLNKINYKEEQTLDNNYEKHINLLREKILEAQLIYLKDAKSFIKKLEQESPKEIYNTLINLNDIRYIQHSISKLSVNTLNNLLEYILKLNNETHSSINIFMEEVIKKNIHKNNK